MTLDVHWEVDSAAIPALVIPATDGLLLGPRPSAAGAPARDGASSRDGGPAHDEVDFLAMSADTLLPNAVIAAQWTGVECVTIHPRDRSETDTRLAYVTGRHLQARRAQSGWRTSVIATAMAVPPEVAIRYGVRLIAHHLHVVADGTARRATVWEIMNPRQYVHWIDRRLPPWPTYSPRQYQ